MSEDVRIRDLLSDLSDDLIETRALADVLWETSDETLADDTRPALSRMLLDRLILLDKGISAARAMLPEKPPLRGLSSSKAEIDPGLSH